MSFGLSNRGEELQYTQGLVGVTVDIVPYLDNADVDGDGQDEGDDLSDTASVAEITTEPSDFTRPSHTITQPDVAKVDGDFGVQFSVDLDVSSLGGDIDAVALVESGTSNIIARGGIANPEPGPFQALIGLKTLTVSPLITTD